MLLSYLQYNMIRAFFVLGSKFCKFKYYKDLAKQINYPTPKLNDELGLVDNDKCWLLGYRYKLKLPQTKQPQISIENNTSNSHIDSQKPQNENSEVQFEYDPLAKQQTKYGDIHKFAMKNDLDICAADLQTKELTLIPLRQQIYRKFYQQKIYKAKSTGKKYKQIRVPQNIQDHDILNKVANIKSLIKKGQFKFKIYSENDSNKSESKVKKLCQYLGRKPKVSIQEFQIQQKLKGQRRIVIQRWNATLDFSEESKIDYEKINKKWRRKIINQKVSKQRQASGQTKIYDLEGLENEPIQIQREVLKDLRQAKMPFPSKFKEYSDMEDILQSGGSRHLLISQENQRGNYQKKIKRFRYVKQKLNKAQNQQQLEEESSDHQFQQQQDVEIQKGEMNRQKTLRKQLNLRTVEQILDEIDQTKKKKGQLGPYEMSKIKNLQNQLKNIFRKKNAQ